MTHQSGLQITAWALNTQTRETLQINGMVGLAGKVRYDRITLTCQFCQ
jgi:hypothetical protein